MTNLRFPRKAWACLLVLTLSAPTFAAETPMAARLSAALGDTLDAGMISRDLPGHGGFQANAPLNLGRSAAYRRQVASLVDHSHLATSAH